MEPPVGKVQESNAAATRARLETGIPFLDELVTRITGKALPGQKPLIEVTPIAAFAVSCLMLLASAGAVLWLANAVASGALPALLGVPTLLLGQVSLVGRLRAQQVIFAHHAVHKTFCGGHRTINRWIAELGTVISLSQNPEDYRNDHVGKHHRPQVFSSAQDPDAAFLLALGFLPGMSSRALYRKLLKTLLSPAFHATFLKARIRSNFIAASWSRRAMAAAWVTILAAISAAVGPAAAIAGILLPFTLLYHISAILQFSTEHRWMSGPFSPSDAAAYAARSHGRFALAEMPARHLPGAARLAAWSWWAVRQSGDLLFRLGVTVGDLPGHDFHHVVGRLRRRPDQWPQVAFERQAAIDEGDQLGLGQREALGSRQAFAWVFEGLALSPASFQPEE